MHAVEIFISKFSLQFQIVSNTVTMHALEIFISKFSLHVQIVSNSVRMHTVRDIVLIFFSAVPNRFKYRHNAIYGDIVFMFSLQFPIVSNSVRMLSLEK